MIRLRTLGALDIRGADGQELRGVLAQPRRAALLGYLALAAPRGPRRRDTLLAAFWPEQDAEHARNALSQAVHFLRRSLGAEIVVGDGDHLGVERKELWCDVVAFEEALDAGRTAEALELYRGDLLEGFHIANAPEFERWLAGERSRLADRYTKAVEEAAAERERAGDFAGAVMYWRRLAARDPCSSRNALGLMRAMAAAGDPGGAIRHARVHETLLREELSVAPDARVVALVQQLQSSSSEARRPSSGAAPSPPMRSAPDAAVIDDTRASEPPRHAPMVAEAGLAARLPMQTLAGHRRARRSTVIVAVTVATVLTAAVAVLANQEGLTASTPPVRSLAVLPFENLSASTSDRVYADALHDALISELGRYPELSVISRTSVMQYRGSTMSIPDIARELKVDGIVEGALLREGQRIRLNAKLVHGSSDRALWVRGYIRDLQDVLALEAELAAAIAREVRVAVVPQQRRRPTPAGRADSAPAELYLKELYLRGRHAELTRSEVGLQAAKQHYARAVERDPTFALGAAGLSGVHELMGFYDFAPRGIALDSARFWARRAVELDSMLPETRTVLGLSLADDGQFAAAEREFTRAIELGPSNSQAHYRYSMLLVALGRGEEALREATRALSLDPFAPRAVLGMQRSAQFLIDGTRPHLNLPVRERRPILDLVPGEPWARARQGVELAAEERCPEALSEIRNARALVPGNNSRMVMHAGQAYWLCGERKTARALLADLKKRPDASDDAGAIAVLHTRFGEIDSAFVWLERQSRWTMVQLAFLSADGYLDPLRSDRRFDELLVRLGIRGHPPAAPLRSR